MIFSFREDIALSFLKNVIFAINNILEFLKLKSKDNKNNCICPWRIGDTYAYKLTSNYSKSKNMYGKYIIITMVDERMWYGKPNVAIPIVYLKLAHDFNDIPKNIVEFNSLEYIQTGLTLYGMRFSPLCGDRSIDDQINEKMSREYPRDEAGHLPQYRASLVADLRKKNNRLAFIGNFKNIDIPENEFIIEEKRFVKPCQLKKIEKCVIDLYYLYNKRQSIGYRKLENK